MAGGVEPQSLAQGSLQLLWPSLPTPRALINSVPREAKRREAAWASPVRVVLVTILPPHPTWLLSSMKGLLKSWWESIMWVSVGPGPLPAVWARGGTGLPMAKMVPGAGPQLQGPRLCVCMCACVFAVQCDSGVGKLVLGGSSFLFELGCKLLAGTGTVRVTPLPTSLQLKSPLGLYCCYSY